EFIAQPLNIGYEEFLDSWYALLGEEYPQVREAYERLNVPLYVLSNINDVHADYLHGRWFEEISIACWMSNEIGMDKPSREVFEFVLGQIKCQPSELLFFDDIAENVQSAASLGINAVLVKNPDDVVKKLEECKLLVGKS
ncbi:MAG TPA: HAD-IA family hydrolase, partial [Phycisphaerae bacterium]|nr:HAD-IA family hydrolase [Phycisphaerae bacterium]